jgi:hypothetical protein
MGHTCRLLVSSMLSEHARERLPHLLKRWRKQLRMLLLLLLLLVRCWRKRQQSTRRTTKVLLL